MVLQFAMESEIGTIFLVASAKGLRGVHLSKQSIPMVHRLAGEEPELKILQQASKQLTEYFRGKRKSFNVPFDVLGTPFQKKVWNALSTIPYGKTASYKDIAEKIRNKKAFRAVGTANGKNPLCIIVPCHRVIAADGTLGGYSGGLSIKKKLLALES